MTLLAKLQATGLHIEAHPDWETATNNNRDRVETVGILNHWDAITGWPGVSKYLSNNRFGGILYHIVIRRDGTVHLLSQRYVWHAGSGSSQILSIAQNGGEIPDDSAGPDNQNGNPHFFGVCINYHPDEGPVPRAQYDALVLVNRVLVDHFNLNVGQVARHMDWTTRKRDIDTIDLQTFREDILLGQFTDHEVEQLKDLIRALDEVDSNGYGFAKYGVLNIRDHRGKPPHSHVDDSGHDHDGRYLKSVTGNK